MNFLELATRRHSVRNYSERPVEKKKIEYLLECARLAPSACNRQPWRFLVVRSEERRSALQSCYERSWFGRAPLYIVVCADDDAAWHRTFDNRNHADVDAAIAAEHICLAAEEQGLGSCWVCAFDPEKCIEALGLEAPLRPVAILPIGYAADDTPQPKNRRPLNETVREL